MIRFFGNYILTKLPDQEEHIFKNDFYWFIFNVDICEKEASESFGLGSFFDDISSLSTEVKGVDSFMTWLTLDHLSGVLLEVGKKNTELSVKEIKREFIFSQNHLLALLDFILKKIDYTGNASVEIVKTSCWMIPYGEMLNFKTSAPIPKWLDFKNEIEHLISIYEGKTSIEKFNIETFYWCFKIYCNALQYPQGGGFWSGQCSPEDC